MNPIQLEELSALVDGELSSQREQEIREQLAANPALVTEFQTLQRLDARWRAAATSSALEPTVNVQSAFAPRIPWLAVAALVAVLSAIRLVPKIFDAYLMAAALNLALLSVLLVATVRLMRVDAENDSAITDEAET